MKISKKEIGKKIVKKLGGSLGIVFDSDDKLIHNIEEGDIVDIRDIVVIKREAKYIKTNNHK